MKAAVRLSLVFWVLSGTPSGAGIDDAAYQWFSVPIEVAGLPAHSSFVPVACPIDFSELLRQRSAPGAVDERSLQLRLIQPDGTQVEQSVQFTASPQPRAKSRRLLEGTVPGVSYLAEFDAGGTPDCRVEGTLTWIAQAGADGVGRYRLRFGCLRQGRLIQVPFLPQNLRVFDREGSATPIRYFPRMQFHPQWPLDGVIHVREREQPITSYHLGPTLDQAASRCSPIRRPFLYPVIGPDGVPLTEFGKPHDPTGSHAHHYSLWIAHANVAGQDFWSEQGGVIAHEQLERLEDGPVFGRLVQTTRWLREQHVSLRERRTLTVYRAAADFRLLDLELELSTGDAAAVELGKTPFGFVAVRVAQSMTPFDGGGEILNACGDRNEPAALWKRAAWLDQSGPIRERNAQDPEEAGGPVARWGGIAILDHPDNVNHPTVWHCRNDGWAGAAFNAEGPKTLAGGEKLHLRYRLHLHRHNAIQGQVGERFAEYRAQPAIRVGAPLSDADPQQKASR